MKRCKKCGQLYPDTREYFGSTPSGGRRNVCRFCMRKQAKAYAKKNPDRIRAAANRRHARVQKWKPSDDLKRELFIEQKERCGLCGGLMKREHLLNANELQVEHLTPVDKGGTNDRSNLVLAHRKCNQEKANKDWPEYIAWRVKVGLPIPS